MQKQKRVFICNAFSLQMINFPCDIHVEEINLPLEDCICNAKMFGYKVVSAIGHQDTANVLGLPCNRINVHIGKGDRLIVAQLQGGRLPEGSTTLPEGFSFKFLAVSVEGGEQ